MSIFGGKGTSYEDSPNREAPNRHAKGSRKYKEMVARGSKFADDHKNLPFQFIKPPKRHQPRREVFVLCNQCARVHVVNKNTLSYSCRCSAYVRLERAAVFHSEEALTAYMQDLQDQVVDD